MSLTEVLIALSLLLVAILTMVGYITSIHRASREAKHQAVASMYARSALEQLRDSQADFEAAGEPQGLTFTRSEVLLDGEAAAENNEVGRQAATEFTVLSRTEPISGSIYSMVVQVRWEESGREREVVLESRGQRPF